MYQNLSNFGSRLVAVELYHIQISNIEIMRHFIEIVPLHAKIIPSIRYFDDLSYWH